MRCVCVAAVALALASGARPAAAQPLVLKADTNIRIVERVPAPDLEGLLAPLLQKYLLLSLNRKDLSGPGETVTFTIEARAARWSEVPRADLKDLSDIDGFEIEVKAGADRAVRISGPTMLAAGFGVMRFLEKRLGVTWLFPGDLGLALPAAGEFPLQPGVERVKPAIVSRTYTGMVYSDSDTRGSFRKTRAYPILQGDRYFFEGLDYFRSLRLHFLTQASHNMGNIYPPAKYGQTLPEIYPLKDGKRFIPEEQNRLKGWHPCYSNPKTVEIAIESAKKTFEGGGHCFSLGINDGLRVQCQCEDCKRRGWPGAYFDYVKKVAEAVKSYYPPHLVGVLSYGDVKFPPQDLVLPENVIVMITGWRQEAWRGRASHLGAYDWNYGAGFWVPNFPLKGIKENALAFRKLGVSAYHCEAHPVWAFDAPKVYILSRLLWDPDLDVEAALRAYCDAAFGAGGEPMYRYYRKWAALRDNDPPRDGIIPVGHMGAWRKSAPQFSEMTPETYALLSACLDDTRRRVRPGDELKRLDMAQAFFDYSRNAFEMCQLPRRAYLESVPADWKDLLGACASRIARRAELLDRMRAHKEWFLGAGEDVDDILGNRWEGGGGWTVNNDLNSGVKTLLLNLVQAGKLDDEARKALPDDLRPYAAPAALKPVPIRVQDKHGWYTEDKYVPMSSSVADGVYRFSVRRTDQKIEEGAQAGEFKEHYALARVSLPEKLNRKVFLCEMTVSGRKGRMNAASVAFQYNIGWSPISVSHKFGDAPGTVTLRFLVEPAFPDTDAARKGGPCDLHLLWDPDGADSQVDGTLRVSLVEYAAR